ncbi:MAG: hypothetical protein HP494_11455 [Nitrospira sp.]|nr:hypothetical protein [Nitrospira sp.]
MINGGFSPLKFTLFRASDSFVLDVIDRIPLHGSQADYAKQALRDKRIEHKQYIAEYGEDMPEVSQWKWSGRKKATRRARLL